MRDLDRTGEDEIGRAPVGRRHGHLGSSAPRGGVGSFHDCLDQAQLTSISERDSVSGVEAEAQFVTDRGR
jgi:hypothetical protein